MTQLSAIDEIIPAKRNKRVSVPVIDPVDDFCIQIDQRRHDALQEETVIKQQIEALEAQLLAQRKLIAACDSALTVARGNGGAA